MKNNPRKKMCVVYEDEKFMKKDEEINILSLEIFFTLT